MAVATVEAIALDVAGPPATLAPTGRRCRRRRGVPAALAARDRLDGTLDRP
jgi:hypothetical protein